MVRTTGMFARVVALTAVMVLLLVSTAFASNLDSEAVLDSEPSRSSATIEPGGSVGVGYTFTISGQQANAASFKFFRDWTLVDGEFEGANADSFEVPPRSGSQAATVRSTSGTVSVAADHEPGEYTLDVDIHDLDTDATGARLQTRNIGTFTVTVPEPETVDDTPPVIDYTLDPSAPDGLDGWHTSDVTLTWDITEDESPDSLETDGCEDQSLTADQAEQTYSCSAESDGGAAGPVDVKIKRDATAPHSITFDGIADGDEFYWGSAPDEDDLSCDAVDDLSGYDRCELSGHSDEVGERTLTATAYDKAGNSATAELDYEVLAWEFEGFHRPVTDGFNSVRGGQNVPLKFNVYAGPVGANEVTDPDEAVESIRFKEISCGPGEAAANLQEETDSVGKGLRYSDDQFVYNWKTPKVRTTCYMATVLLKDGVTTIDAVFEAK